MSIDVPELANLEQVRERWRTAVAGVLAKSARKEPAELGEQPEHLLDTQTYDGFAVRPLYTAFDELPEPSLPGEWPYLRGGDPFRDVKSGWKVVEAFPGAAATAAEANAAVLGALGDGVSALLIRVGTDGATAQDLEVLLSGVYLSMAPIIIEAGADYVAAADAMLALVADVEADQRATLSIDLGADPLTAALSGRPAAAIDDVVAVASRVTDERGVRAITVDGTAFHNLGANATWELAAGIAAAVAYLRVLTEAGMPVGKALGQISFRLVADDDQFMTIAKMRAARQLWARVAEVVGEPDAGGAIVHAQTSLPMMTQRDPWVNMLRCTLAAFGAGVGGADTVLVFPFDIAIPGGFPGTARSFACRIARNTQLLLLEESHVGRVLDPAGGSWFVEDLTKQLAQRAWEQFQAVEARGGFVDARDYIAEAIADIAGRRADDIAHRRTAITGVNEFPNLTEPTLPQSDSIGQPDVGNLQRYSAAFEALRDRSDAFLARTGARPQALLLPLGPLAEHNIRATFAANLLASGGIEAVNPGTLDTGAVAAAVSDAGSPAVAVICGTDKRYGTEAAGAVDAARAAGVSRVYLAGPEKAVADTGPQHRPDEYLTAKINAVEALSDLLTRLGA
ncbi:methylmalonyl-CoA mutase small subunit [Mycobacterium montefiorense]|uniref:Methylmalonyl-CoA mutase small subunit n=1 Tax=Mycobacterium montefiorense TaxID=154654 RepID=A0AA37PIR7_9MYCO|nr:methylmalonyl-CoA mutase small subunit [Mycobacterium montefiorense]GBG38466.1 putative methylmalonyl-CoA mutase small subunit [Mycobacterium montefiorense]GKU34295.1 putative methylmalonyl-CoA mutase small subunit [Mycobacterium montefiorense]GKU38915.1 putative methylmalonyl-CoA mutase small subunit [Mycobacterium montefiorense]GKU48050.1 putative methylmalonyl-CoA mutase small subunit [Mycobacterium montefiorense]GKU49678.1 putative methylmalonyl-CoA mutase small subunit [Mycobacterium m